MTRKLNESIPFADIEDDFIPATQEMINRLLNAALEQKQIDEVSYRRLSAVVYEIEGEASDYFIRLLDEFIAAGDAVLLERLVAGAEFIEELSNDDPRYERAVAKHDKLHEQFKRLREREGA